MRSQKFPCAPLKPQNFGSWVLISCKATPALNPVMTVSEMNFTMAPARKTQARKAAAATSRAVHDARAANRLGSPFAIPPGLEPIRSEIAEVTVIAVWRELQKIQKTRPEKRQAYRPASTGNPASEASARAAGRR